MNLSQDRIRDDDYDEDYDDDDNPSTERHTNLYRRRDAYSADSKQTDTDGWQQELQVSSQQHIYFTCTVLQGEHKVFPLLQGNYVEYKHIFSTIT